jgi:hypothetical protein
MVWFYGQMSLDRITMADSLRFCTVLPMENTWVVTDDTSVPVMSSFNKMPVVGMHLMVSIYRLLNRELTMEKMDMTV